MDKENIQSNKIQVQVLISQFKDINERLWQITMLLLIEAIGFAGVLVTLIIKT